VLVSDQGLDLSLHQIQGRMIVAANGVRAALDEYRQKNAEWVEAERDYRHAKAIARMKAKSKLVADREDEVFLMVEMEWTAAKKADVLRDSAKEALRAYQAILSGLQSVAGAHREEARLTNFEPREVSA